MVAVSGTVISDDAPATVVMVLEGQMAATNPVGQVPDGIRLDGYTSGEFPDGILTGATVDGVDYLLVRHDGVGVIDVRGYIVDRDGVPVSHTMKGFLGEPSGLLEAMLDPDFEFPNGGLPIHGADEDVVKATRATGQADRRCVTSFGSRTTPPTPPARASRRSAAAPCALMSRGIGWVGVQLLAAELLAGTPIWILDLRLVAVAAELGAVAAGGY